MRPHAHGPIFLVTVNNHAWISEQTGWSLTEIQNAFDSSLASGLVCTMTKKPANLRTEEIMDETVKPSPTYYVEEFHDTYGAPVRTYPKIDIPELQKKLRKRLLNEETKEFCDAVDANDLVEIADALGDIVYVAYGAALTFGIPLDEVLEEVHRSNMSKLAEDGTVIRDEFGKVLKGPNYFKPDIKSILDAHDGFKKEE